MSTAFKGKASTRESVIRGRVVGILLALLGVGNLVHGLWLQHVPWLNLTIVSLVLLGLVVLRTPPSRLGRPGTAVGWLCLSFLPGFVEPALNPGTDGKRTEIIAIVIGSILISFAASGSGRFIALFALTIVGSSMIVLAAQWVVPDHVELALSRRTPIGVNPIGAGRLLGIGAVASIWFLFLRKALTWRAGWIIVAISLLVGLVASGSRGPAVGTVVGGVVLLLSMTNLPRIFRAFLAIGAIAAVYYFLMDLGSSGSRIASGDDSGRGNLLSFSVKVGSQNLGGIGWGNLFSYLPRSLVENDQGYKQYPHNILVEFFVESGVLGLIILLFALVGVVAQGIRWAPLPERPLLLALFTASFVGAMFSSDVIGNQLFWVLCGVTLGAANRGRLVRSANAVERMAPNADVTRGLSRRPSHWDHGIAAPIWSAPPGRKATRGSSGFERSGAGSND